MYLVFTVICNIEFGFKINNDSILHKNKKTYHVLRNISMSVIKLRIILVLSQSSIFLVLSHQQVGSRKRKSYP